MKFLIALVVGFAVVFFVAKMVAPRRGERPQPGRAPSDPKTPRDMQ